MSRTNPINALTRRPPRGACWLAVLAWLALLLAPVAAQAMTRLDTGVPGAVICSVNKSVDQDGDKAAAPHCPVCTLAQQALDLPLLSSTAAVAVAVAMPPQSPAVTSPPARAPPRANPPRAPPLS